MGILTEAMPKPLLPSPGNSLIQHQINLLRKHVKYLSVTIGYQKEKMKQGLANSGVDSLMDVEGHGNAYFIHSLENLPHDSRILVITCDNLMSIDLKLLEKESNSIDASLIIPKENSTVTTGDFIEHKDGLVSAMRRQTGIGLVASGLQVIHTKELSILQESGVDDFNQVWDCLMERDSLKISKTPIENWWAIDTEETLNEWINSNG